jgi:hypothetical protein
VAKKKLTDASKILTASIVRVIALLMEAVSIPETPC